MKKLFPLLLLFISLSLGAQIVEKKALTLMGSRFEISIVDKDTASARQNIREVAAEISRIEDLISEWRPGTQISEVNRNAGLRPVKVDPEVFELTRHALYFSKITRGAFDISIAAMDRIWKFDGSLTKLPTEAQIKKSVENVGYGDIILDSLAGTIFLRRPGMKIGFGSIGKGYAADRGREIMQKKGVPGGIVNASGDLATWGAQPGGKPWKIGIQNPSDGQKALKVLRLRTGAVATSGDYEKFVSFGGRRYAHIINPKTGWPATGLTSVTVSGPSAEFANGLSTSIMVLGEREGRKLIRRFPAYRATVIRDGSTRLRRL